MRLNHRGDTLVEVLLATVVISIVLAGAYSLSNRATRINQTAIERSTATNYMREQIELVRGLRSTGYKLGAWQEITDNYETHSAPAAFDNSSCPPATPSGAFYVDIEHVKDYTNRDFIKPYTKDHDTRDDLYQIWMEAYSPAATSGYIDFYVRACWEGIGDTPIQTSELIMRLAK